jgi:hypothetical protein
MLLGAAFLAATCTGNLPWRESGQTVRWKQWAGNLRELDFREPVQFRWVTRDELTAFARQVSLIHGSTRGGRYRDAYAALGLLPAGQPVAGNLGETLKDVVGVYVPWERSLFVVVGRGRTPLTTGMTVVHELVHVLQHQHFPEIFDFRYGLIQNDDVVRALVAVLEGDAALTALATDPREAFARDLKDALIFQQMMLGGLEESGTELPAQTDSEAQTEQQEPGGKQLDLVVLWCDPEDLEELREERVTLLGGGSKPKEAPLMLRMTRVFPYAYGIVFMALAYAQDGNRALNAQLRSPPLSTLQLHFPDEDRPVEFIRLPLGELASALSARGCKLGYNNVAGALILRVLLQEQEPGGAHEALLRSCSGDRFVHVYCPDGWELAWATRWRNAAAAADFAGRFRAAAADLARSTPLSGPAQVRVTDRTAWVLSPGLLDQEELLRKESEIRSYSSFLQWKADGCFPEPACPGPFEARTRQ